MLFLVKLNPEYTSLKLLVEAKGTCALFFIFVSREEKGFHRIVSLGHLGHQHFDCRSYCRLSCRMQGNDDDIMCKGVRLPYTLNQTINNNFSLVNRILAAAQD